MSGIFKWIGGVLILSAVFLSLQHSRMIIYNFDGSSFIVEDTMEVPSNHFLADTDGLGIKKWYYTERMHERLENPKYVNFPTNVIVLEVSLFLLGLLMFFNSNRLFKRFLNNISRSFVIIVILFASILTGVGYLYYLVIATYYKDFKILLYFVIYIPVILCFHFEKNIFAKKTMLSNWHIIFYLAILPFIIANSMQIEVYSHIIEPEALVDKLWIVVAFTTDKFIHHWSLPYLWFRLSNLLIIVFSVLLLIAECLTLKQSAMNK